MLNLTEANDLLKNFYIDGVSDVLNNKILLLSRIEKNTEDFEGKNGIIALHIGRNEGVGARLEGETLPTAGSQKYDNATFQMTYQYGRINITGPTIFATKSDEGSYLRAVDSEVRGVTRDLKNDWNRQLYNDGSGALTTVSAASTTSSVTITVASVKHVKKGQYVDVLDSSTGAAGTNSVNRKITAVNSSTLVVTLEGSGNYVTLPSNATLYRHNNRNKEFNGLQGIVSTANPSKGNFGAIDRTTEEWWRGNVIDAGNVDLSLDLMDQAKDTSDINGDGNISIIITDHAQSRKYAKLLTPDRRFPTADGKPVKLDGGYSALDYDGIPVVRDKDAPAQRMFFLDEESMQFFEQAPMQWMDKDGSVLSRIGNTDAYEATLFSYAELGDRDPANHTQIHTLRA